ncbi:major facilitator superfamily domain-containing protein [Leptodontidium sp. MPI-SDFR-AT-0119]|nr:major facilitator superfamily domain-containing protein [Leptodontidium sp. MPI-SDFR-AT-0119]
MATSITTLQEPFVELSHWNRDRDSNNDANEIIPRRSREISGLGGEDVVIQQLLPADGGPAAWRLLIAAFVFEALLWGFPISFGVFQDYYSKQPEFEGSSQIALIGTMAQGLCYLGAPLSALLTKRFPKYHRQQIWVGWPICIGGLVAASFTSSVGGLIATQGVMYGLGFIILTYPIICMVDEWWIQRKGMAFGVISCASGASGAVMPFITSALLEKYGYKTTLQATAVAMALLTGPLMPLLKGRLPPSEQGAIARVNWSFLKKPLFYIYAVSTLVQGLGFFFPAIYLPTYATALGLSATEGALILAIMSISQTLGQFAVGFMTDKKFPVTGLVMGCSVMATIAVLAIWGLAKSLHLLILFSIVYGVFASAFSPLRVGMGKAVSDDPSAVVAMYAILVFCQGIGNVLVGPISSALLSQRSTLDAYAISRFRNVVIFTGGSMFLSGIVVIPWMLWPRQKRAGFGRD